MMFLLHSGSLPFPPVLATGSFSCVVLHGLVVVGLHGSLFSKDPCRIAGSAVGSKMTLKHSEGQVSHKPVHFIPFF